MYSLELNAERQGFHIFASESLIPYTDDVVIKCVHTPSEYCVYDSSAYLNHCYIWLDPEALTESLVETLRLFRIKSDS